MTAEAALVIPLLVALSAALVWVVSIGVAKVRAVDAARDSARELARGESPADVTRQADLPERWRLRWTAQGDDVTVTVQAKAEAPSWLIVPLPDVDISSQATVRVESAVGSTP